jgi:2-oxoglutarate dehydrogenase E2 component (dihydrolipoamide succinyltransferase)
MLIDVQVPPLAESLTDVTLLPWRRKAGDPVARGEPLVDLETDKVTLEITAPEAGVLREIVKAEGSRALAGEVLARIDTAAAVATGGGAGASASAAPPVAAASATAFSPSAALAASAAAPATPPTATPATTSAPTPAPATPAPAPGAAPKAGPAARHLLAEHGLPATAVPAPAGRLRKQDVLHYLAAGRTAAGPLRVERRAPLSRLRLRVAERLLAAQRGAAILTTFNEIDLSAVQGIRQRQQKAFEERHGVRLGLLSFFVRACCAALQAVPAVNARIDGQESVYYDYCDIGLAVSSPRGLVVPVLRNAEALGFAEIEQAVRDFSSRAGNGTLALEDMTGGTFTITNGGVFGSLLSTPILNPPQSGILGMHKIQDRPVAVDGQVAIRPMMYVALSYDHRLIDGREAVQFLVHIKDALEDPTRLLLDL